MKNSLTVFLILSFIFFNDTAFCEAGHVESSTCGVDMPRGTICPKCGETKEFWENQTWYERHGFVIVVILIPVCITFSVLQYIYIW
jgi:hypothetical protein|tara:strand:- start:1423 stop:1680 length:258 start_codon:yes stop_codon:yes gene_type:complete